MAGVELRSREELGLWRRHCWAGVLRRPTTTQSQGASREHGWLENRDVDKWYCVGLYSFLETIVFALQWKERCETARLIAVP